MPNAKATHYRLAEMPQDEPMPLARRRLIRGEQAMLAEIFVDKGCDTPIHAHENEQFAVLLSGRLRLTVADGAGGATRDVVLEAGDVLHLPGNVPHGATALEDCRILDIFSPPSETTGIDQG